MSPWDLLGTALSNVYMDSYPDEMKTGRMNEKAAHDTYERTWGKVLYVHYFKLQAITRKKKQKLLHTSHHGQRALS